MKKRELYFKGDLYIKTARAKPYDVFSYCCKQVKGKDAAHE